MFYWSIWSLVALVPYLIGFWHDRGSLLYFAGVVFGILVVLSLRKGGREPLGLTKVLLFAAVNGVLVLMLGPWILAVAYIAILIFYFLKFNSLFAGVTHGATGSFGSAAEPGERIPRRDEYRGRVG